MIKERTIVPPKRASQQQKTRQRQLKRAIKFIAYVGLSVLAAVTSLSTSYMTASFFATSQWKRLSTLGLLILSVLILLIAIEFLVKFLNKVLYNLNEKLDWAAGALADFVINKIEIFLLRLWWQLTAPRFLRTYYTSLVDTHRDFEIEGFQLNFRVVDLEDVFVPLQVADEVPGNLPGAMLQINDLTESYEIWDFLDIPKEENYRSRHIAVIAPPGSGKTTILKHLTLTYAQNKQHRQAPKLIPILLYLRHIHNEISRVQPPNLPELTTAQIENVLSHYKINFPPNWFEEQLKQGRCLVMLDGLDEVADISQRQKVSEWISHQMTAYRKNAFILTSRKHGYLSTPLEKVGRVLTVKPFNISQIEYFLGKWYLQTEIKRHNGRNDLRVKTRAQQCADDLLERIKNSYQIAAMAQNPLLLAMIATVHYMKNTLPERRVELYDKICDVLLGDRQRAKKIPDILTPRQKKGVLQVLALSLMRQQIVEFDRNLGISLIKEKLEAVTSEVTPEQFLDEAETVNGLLMQIKEGYYSFVHKSFQEYLAAVQIKELNEEQLLIEKFYDEWWTETIRLYAAQTDATKLADEALKNPNVFSLTLAYGFLEEQATIEPKVRKRLTELLEDGLESSQLEIAKLAAQVKLSHRLKQQFSTENVIIDKSYITCAEYQLFIEEKLKEGQDFRPVHWKAERFAHGDAKKPITGVYANAAQEFCEWLTQKYLVLEFRYRLPNLAEAEREQPTTEQPVGCWCQDGDTKALANIKPFQWKIWKQDLVNACARDLATARDLNSVFNQETDSDLSVALEKAGFLERAETLPPNRSFAFENIIDLECDLTVIFDGIITLEQKQAQNLELAINQTLKRAEERICRRKKTLTSRRDTTFKAKQDAGNSLTHAEASLQNCIATVKPFQDKVSECQENYDDTNKLVDSFEQQIKQKQDLQEKLAQARQRTKTLESQLKEARELEEVHQPDEPLEHQQAEARQREKAAQQAVAHKRTKTLEHQLKKARQQADDIEHQLQQEEVIQNIARPELELKKVRKVAQSLKDKLEEARQRAAPFDRQLEAARQGVESFRCELDQASKEFKSLERELANIETLQNKLASVHSSGTHRSYLLFIYMLLDSLVGCNYATKKAELHKLYILLVLKDERQSGHMPAWEGIRIVGEKV